MNANLKTFASQMYARNLDAHPYHRFYNVPAILSVLPDVGGLKVLDAGCGTGYFCEYFQTAGANVTALDITPEMVARTRARVPSAKVMQADLAGVLPLEAEPFDLVFSSLTLQYVENWQGTFTEFARVLKPAGLLIFSVHHPFAEFREQGKDYFEVERFVRNSQAGQQIKFRRPLSYMTEVLTATGFDIEVLLEPKPSPQFAESDPEGYELLCRQPGLIVFRAKRR
jgi:SAM-dependent methyltransferase